MLIGLAFMVLTLMGASVTFSEWKDYQKTPELWVSRFTFFGLGGLTILLAILCLYSFVKARNVR